MLPLYKLNKFQDQAPNVAVMLESRFIEKDAETVLRQFGRFLDTTQWCMQLFLTQNCIEKYQALTERLDNNIQIILLPVEITSAQEYSNILMLENFWKQFENFKNVLIFQLDTMIFQYGIEKYLQYDYVGAPWAENVFGKIFQVGNGGLSLRNVQATLTCLTSTNRILIPYKYVEDKYCPEDVFLAFAMIQLGLKIAPVNTAKLFSIETVEHHLNPIGSHQLYRFDADLYEKLLKRSIIPYYNITKFKNIFDNNFNGILLATNTLEIKDTDKWVGFFNNIDQNLLPTFKNCQGILLYENNTFSHPLIEHVQVQDFNSLEDQIKAILNSNTTAKILTQTV